VQNGQIQQKEYTTTEKVFWLEEKKKEVFTLRTAREAGSNAVSEDRDVSLADNRTPFQLPVPKTRREGLARDGRDSTQVPVEFTGGE
jgi:Neuraminidase (sialidase)